MKSTVSTDFLFFALLWGGCALWAPPRYGLIEAQHAARSRLLEIRRAEFLDKAAKIQIEHTKTVPLLRAAQNCRGELRNAADDPALKSVDKAIIYAKIALAEKPETEAAFWAAKSVDFDAAVFCCKYVCNPDEETRTALLFVTGWSAEQLRQFDFTTLKTPEFHLFPAHPESEQFLQKEKENAPFLLAAELYRAPSKESITRALYFRKTLLNTHLLRCGMRSKSDPRRILELRLIKLREEFFSASSGGKNTRL